MDHDTGSENRQTREAQSYLTCTMVLDPFQGAHRTRFLESGNKLLTLDTWSPRRLRRYRGGDVATRRFFRCPDFWVPGNSP